MSAAAGRSGASIFAPRRDRAGPGRCAPKPASASEDAPRRRAPWSCPGRPPATHSPAPLSPCSRSAPEARPPRSCCGVQESCGATPRPGPTRAHRACVPAPPARPRCRRGSRRPPPAVPPAAASPGHTFPSRRPAWGGRRPEGRPGPVLPSASPQRRPEAGVEHDALPLSSPPGAASAGGLNQDRAGPAPGLSGHRWSRGCRDSTSGVGRIRQVDSEGGRWAGWVGSLMGCTPYGIPEERVRWRLQARVRWRLDPPPREGSGERLPGALRPSTPHCTGPFCKAPSVGTSWTWTPRCSFAPPVARGIFPKVGADSQDFSDFGLCTLLGNGACRS